jgi:hypothetical protein
MPSATIRFGDGQHSSARLQTISVTGGLLQVVKPLSSGAVVELMFSTHIGSVLAMAELLRPCSPAPIGLQPFRFIAMDNSESRKLHAAIASSEKAGAQSPSASLDFKQHVLRTNLTITTTVRAGSNGDDHIQRSYPAME